MKHKLIPELILILLVLLALACQIPTNIASPQPTMDTQGTVAAAVAATDASQANVNATIQAAIAATGAAAPPTAAQLPTPIPPTVTVIEAKTPVATAAATANVQIPLDPIHLTDWKMQFFVAISTGCRFPNLPCWMADDDYKKHLGSSDLMLIGQSSVYVDPKWANPYLIFWQERDLQSAAYLEIQANDTWIKVRDYTKSYHIWAQEAIYLRDFIGKKIALRFVASGMTDKGGVPKSKWLIQDVQVVPVYTPSS